MTTVDIAALSAQLDAHHRDVVDKLDAIAAAMAAEVVVHQTIESLIRNAVNGLFELMQFLREHAGEEKGQMDQYQADVLILERNINAIYAEILKLRAREGG